MTITRILTAFFLVALVSIGSWYLFTTAEHQNPFKNQLSKYEKVKHLTSAEIQNLPKRDRPDLALLQEYETTKDLSLGYPPVSRKLQAFRAAKEKLARKAAAKAIANVEWTERGPNNVGGRTRALMYDPNDSNNKKVWAGGVSGGIWYNDDITNEESSWINIDDFMANLSISTLTYDPGSTTTFYAGTGESFTADFRGTGIWKSTDAGDSWSQLESTADFGYTTKIVVTSSSTIIAATSEGIKVSSDGGSSWTSPSTVTGDMADLEIASNDDLICGDFSGNIYRSTDGGSTWSDISPDLGGERVEMAIAPSNSSTYYAAAASGDDIGWMVVSSDAGENWSEITIPKYLNQSTCEESSDDFSRGQAWYDLILAVNPSDEDEVLVGGIDLYKSTDGGDNWTAISYWTGGCKPYVHADQHAIVFKPGSSSEAIFGNDGGVYYSSNIDQSSPGFGARNNNYNVTQFYALAMRNEINSNDLLAGSQDNGTQQFSDFEINSTQEATGGDGAYCFIDQNEPDIQLASYIYNNYYISRDGGASFEEFGKGDTGNFINPSDYDDEANILYARGTGANKLNRYTIGSNDISTKTLTVSVGGGISHILVSEFEDHVLYIGTSSGTIRKVTNANTDSPTVTSLHVVSGTITSIDVQDNGQKLLATVGNYGNTSVYYSSDAGENWTNVEGDLPDMPVWWGMFNRNDNSEVLLATEVGVWSTDDITTTSVAWEPTNEGLANVSCRMLQYRSSDQQYGVATHGRGLYTTLSFSKITHADFTAQSLVGYAGQNIAFTNTSLGNSSDSEWSVSDGSTYSTKNISHTFDESGLYDVTLSLDDENSKTSQVVILPKRPANYVASFENEPLDSYADNVKGSTIFELGNSSISGKNGVVSGEKAWVLGISDASYSNGGESYIYFPEYDFSEDGTYNLSFQTNHSFESNWDGFYIEYSLDRGQEWVKIGSSVESNWYNQLTDAGAIFGDNVPIFSGSTSGYELKEKDVSFLSTESSVVFRLVYKSDGFVTDIGMALDDFKITGPDSDLVPDFSTHEESECDLNTVSYYDNSSIGVNSYSWSFGSNATPSSATGIGPHEVTYTQSVNNTVKLTVTDDNDQSFTASKEISIVVRTTPDVTISIDDNVLSVPGGADTYEWYMDDVLIEGADESSYTTNNSGEYFVIVTSNECTATSEKVAAGVLGIDDSELKTNIYPNPSSGIINLEYPGVQMARIYSLTGKMVLSAVANQDKIRLDISNLLDGIYIVEISDGINISTEKIILNKN